MTATRHDAMPLHLYGASVRAAAQSAARAGIAVEAFDLFADRDLAATCRAERVDRDAYPEAFEAIARGSSGPWMYTGALENYPDVIDRIAMIRPLWGIGGAALRAARDPEAVGELLARRGLLAPESRSSPEGLPRDGSWLVKPRLSAGGRSIRPFAGDDAPARPSFYQERIDGPSLAALFVGLAGESRLLGVTRQILGRVGEPFAYVGSIGPWPVALRTRGEIEAIGTTLVESLGLGGLFGVDLVVRRDGRPVVIEVNPRYTASAEVLELASGRPLLLEHVRAFDPSSGSSDAGGSPVLECGSLLPLCPVGEASPRAGASSRGTEREQAPALQNGRIVGKAILFADRRSTVPAIDGWRPRGLGSFAVPTVADIPAAGTTFDAGDPVLTVLARGSSPERCEARLMRRLARWRGRMRPLDGDASGATK